MLNSLPLCNWPILATSDPDLTYSHMRSNLRPNELWFPEEPKIAFEHNKVMLNSMSLNSINYGSEVRIQAPPTENVYLVILTLDGEGIFKQNKSVSVTKPGDVCVLNPNFPLEISLSDNFKQLTLQLDGKQLNHYASRIIGYQLKDPLIFQPVGECEVDNVSGFISLIKTICNNINKPSSSMLDKQVAKNLEAALISLLLAEFPNNYSDYAREGTQQIAPFYIRRAQNYIHAHFSENFSLDQLAIVTGVGVRTLQKGFKSVLGTSPVSYIRAIRLEMARKRLLVALENKESVTDIAYSCGFGHLNKFTKYYKEYFGETPNQTKGYKKNC